MDRQSFTLHTFRFATQEEVDQGLGILDKIEIGLVVEDLHELEGRQLNRSLWCHRQRILAKLGAFLADDRNHLPHQVCDIRWVLDDRYAPASS